MPAVRATSVIVSTWFVTKGSTQHEEAGVSDLELTHEAGGTLSRTCREDEVVEAVRQAGGVQPRDRVDGGDAVADLL